MGEGTVKIRKWEDVVIELVMQQNLDPFFFLNPGHLFINSELKAGCALETVLGPGTVPLSKSCDARAVCML